ncbi:MAG: NADH-quinone oxidoreductase subunit F, partial [Thermodesulfobacteriota bacterium]
MEKINQVLLHRDNRVGAELAKWIERGGGEALSRALEDPPAVIKLIEAAGLRGLGGSGFPTHVKWGFVAPHPGRPDKYLVCNGNEDEPGTFKDQVLMSEAPHQVIEGALIAAVATGINKVVFYINPDIDRSIAAMRLAVKQWEESEYLQRVSEVVGKQLELSIHLSSGHYIGGEETAAMESVEGKFPFPRGKPPFPAESGVLKCQTLINNIETLANVPHIVRNGPDW